MLRPEERKGRERRRRLWRTWTTPRVSELAGCCIEPLKGFPHTAPPWLETRSVHYFCDCEPSPTLETAWVAHQRIHGHIAPCRALHIHLLAFALEFTAETCLFESQNKVMYIIWKNLRNISKSAELQVHRNMFLLSKWANCEVPRHRNQG